MQISLEKKSSQMFPLSAYHAMKAYKKTSENY